MAVLHLVHGFNVFDGGKKTVAKLMPYLERHGHEVKIFSYGWVGLLGVWFLNPRFVTKFGDRVEPGDSAVGHSNGCVIIHMAAIYGAPLRILFYFSPPLKRDLPIPEQVEKVIVNHTRWDSAVKFGRWLRLLVPWAPLGDPIWGDMGAIGYGPDSGRGKEYPHYTYERVVFWIESLAISSSIFRFLLRVTLGIPFGLLYWLFLGPVELFVGFIANNILHPGRIASLSLRHREGRKYLFFAGVIPVVSWTVILLVLDVWPFV